MIIRQLINEDMPQAIELKISCWTEELAGKAKNTLEHKKELKFWMDWMNTQEENNDVRLLLGGFEDSDMLGVAFASFVDSKDAPEHGIELNGLWVFPQFRGKGVSLRLIWNILDYFIPLGVTRLEVYNPHYAPSNGFYRKFGGRVIGNECQMDGKLPVDIFEFDASDLKMRIENASTLKDERL